MNLPKGIFIPNQHQFRFSTIAVKEVREKLVDVELENLLNKSLNLLGYTQCISHLDFIFIIIPSHLNIHAERKHYTKSKHELILELVLDYTRFSQATPQEAKEMMATLYLEAIKTYPTIRGMKKVQFDCEKFYTDVKALLESEGWLRKD